MAACIWSARDNVMELTFQGHPFILAHYIEHQLKGTVSFMVEDDEYLARNKTTYRQLGPNHYQITLSTISLVGKLGVLPQYYQRYYQSCLRQRRQGLKAFIHIFQSRLAYLEYQAWSHRQFIHCPENIKPLLNGIAGLINSHDFDLLLHYSGCLATRPLNPQLIQSLLQHYLITPVRLLSFQGRWLNLAQDRRTCLTTQKNTLGHQFILGKKVRHLSSLCEIQLGPMNQEHFLALLPKGRLIELLQQLLTLLLPPHIQYRLRLVLLRQAVPMWHLSGNQALGLTSWLGQRKKDSADLVYKIIG